MASHYGHSFDAAIRRLRTQCPIDQSVYVRTVPYETLKQLANRYSLETDHSLCLRCDESRRFTIVIRRGMSLGQAQEALAHEWAHAADYQRRGTFDNCHNGEWGRNYARCYRAVFGET